MRKSQKENSKEHHHHNYQMAFNSNRYHHCKVSRINKLIKWISSTMKRNLFLMIRMLKMIIWDNLNPLKQSLKKRITLRVKIKKVAMKSTMNRIQKLNNKNPKRKQKANMCWLFMGLYSNQEMTLMIFLS